MVTMHKESPENKIRIKYKYLSFPFVRNLYRNVISLPGKLNANHDDNSSHSSCDLFYSRLNPSYSVIFRCSHTTP